MQQYITRVNEFELEDYLRNLLNKSYQINQIVKIYDKDYLVIYSKEDKEVRR